MPAQIECESISLVSPPMPLAVRNQEQRVTDHDDAVLRQAPMSCSPTSTTAIGTFTRSPKNAVTMIYAPLRASATPRLILCAARESTLSDTVSPSLSRCHSGCPKS